MRGVLVEEWTEFEKLRLAECPRSALQPRQVRIRTQAAGVSFATSLVVSGNYQRKPPLPFVPGTEIAGIVTEVADGVTRFKVGDRVASVIDWGGLAEETPAFEVNTFKIPDSLEFHKAICFTNSYGTSYAALMWPHLLRVEAGQTLLVHGAAGGVGVAAVEIGKILGATVIATAGSAEKLDIVRDHGADHAINYREGPFREQVLELTNGRGADAIYDPVGGEVFEQSLRCIAPEGRIMPVGFAAGTIQQIPANILLVKNITVCGLNMGYYNGWSPDDVRDKYADRMAAMMAQLFAWYDEGRLKPRVSATFALDDFQQAMAMVLGRKAQGRVAVVMDEEAARLGR
ncbi:MAG: NADPH:quinone oxidoreductase family protein [Rhodospirillaceae bacterium]|jgi:NADPH:quinone reductase|nr:NADPH:quinone oxidoreductase family protein [Rhodospirillaceae bacterium]MBT5665380.1 NADPH:quinone oxidoreductase family protein [Rhodospirillaceae bacterium]MBT5810911.1 NADPH:quinone oxidoreductase family protein [Rhodospirillaceae bacterium]